jgi:hypothetical protein
VSSGSSLVQVKAARLDGLCCWVVTGFESCDSHALTPCAACTALRRLCQRQHVVQLSRPLPVAIFWLKVMIKNASNHHPITSDEAISVLSWYLWHNTATAIPRRLRPLLCRAAITFTSRVKQPGTSGWPKDAELEPHYTQLALNQSADAIMWLLATDPATQNIINTMVPPRHYVVEIQTRFMQKVGSAVKKVHNTMQNTASCFNIIAVHACVRTARLHCAAVACPCLLSLQTVDQNAACHAACGVLHRLLSRGQRCTRNLPMVHAFNSVRGTGLLASAYGARSAATKCAALLDAHLSDVPLLSLQRASNHLIVSLRYDTVAEIMGGAMVMSEGQEQRLPNPSKFKLLSRYSGFILTEALRSKTTYWLTRRQMTHTGAGDIVPYTSVPAMCAHMHSDADMNQWFSASVQAAMAHKGGHFAQLLNVRLSGELKPCRNRTPLWLLEQSAKFASDSFDMPPLVSTSGQPLARPD